MFFDCNYKPVLIYLLAIVIQMRGNSKSFKMICCTDPWNIVKLVFGLLDRVLIKKDFIFDGENELFYYIFIRHIFELLVFFMVYVM